jgi:hypothetical protein
MAKTKQQLGGRLPLGANQKFSYLGVGIIAVLAAGVGIFIILSAHASSPPASLGHYADTYWYWPSAPSGFYNMDALITPQADGSPDGYYFSNYFVYNNDTAHGGYIGLQTNGSAPTGKIAIFSLWGATSGHGPQYAAPFGGEGTGYSVRISYPWVVNHTYRLRVWYTGNASLGDTWDGYVKDQNTGVESWIGSILAPPGVGLISPSWSATFHERYTGSTAGCSSMNYSSVTFTGITANNGSIAPMSHTNIEIDMPLCRSLYGLIDIPGGVRSIIGGARPISTPAPAPSPAASSVPTPKPVVTAATAQKTPVTTTQSAVNPATSTAASTPTNNADPVTIAAPKAGNITLSDQLFEHSSTTPATISGIATIPLPSQTNNVKYVEYQMDEGPVWTAKKAPFGFRLQTSRYKNGVHSLVRTISYENGSLHRETVKLNIQNKLTFWQKLSNGLTWPWWWLSLR